MEVITKVDRSWCGYGQMAKIVLLRRKDQHQLWPLYISTDRWVDEVTKHIVLDPQSFNGLIREELVYIPTCGKLLFGSNDPMMTTFEDYLPVHLCTGWAQDKIGGGKWEVVHATVQFTSMLPDRLIDR